MPDNWTIHFSEEHIDMGPSMEWFRRRLPDAKFYGWIADDCRPRTMYWDKLLEAEAGRWNISHCRDDYICLHETHPERSLCGAFCWGGDLVRAAGFWSPPGYIQAGIDDTWVQLCGPSALDLFAVQEGHLRRAFQL